MVGTPSLEPRGPGAAMTAQPAGDRFWLGGQGKPGGSSSTNRHFD
jgi:hypothetical protein